MSSYTGVFQRKPFKSGDSKVITVTGMPAIPENGRLNIKLMRVDGYKCLLFSSYKELSLHEMEQLPDEIKTEDPDGYEVLTTHDTVSGLAGELSGADLDVPEDKELALTLRDK